MTSKRAEELAEKILIDLEMGSFIQPRVISVISEALDQYAEERLEEAADIFNHSHGVGGVKFFCQRCDNQKLIRALKTKL